MKCIEMEAKVIVDGVVWEEPFEKEVEIVQTYIKDEEGVEERVRRIKDISSGKISFTHTIKETLKEKKEGKLIRNEKESVISEEEYLKLRQKGIKEITKIRRFYKGTEKAKEVIIDKINQDKDFLYLMEVEIKSDFIDEDTLFEDLIVNEQLKNAFLNGKNVSNDKNYKNANLALKL